MKNVEQRRMTGFVTHEDIIRMDKLKNELFPDYNFLNRCLEAQSESIKNRSRPPVIKDLIRPSETKIYADNELIPLSFSGISNPQKTVTFRSKGNSKKANGGFIEHF